ncbi:MAG: dTDP-glucose 4,6-dehydratase [Proteobacteria bacterium]|nr:dTDP-glucose 4,6-dehydratase [Pseudomonadota bacterium]
MKVLVTGAAGFIGSNLIHYLRCHRPTWNIVSLDKLTYCANLEWLSEFHGDPRHSFYQCDIADTAKINEVFARENPDAVMHLAAESHVDRSILEPLDFVRTNVLGTAVLLEVARNTWKKRSDVRFLHVSTDEVFGALGPEGMFSEDTNYDPSSPYSASKAAGDHFVRAWYRTYGLPILITNTCNNYGPRQFPEKLIPVVISRALNHEPVPIYGQGQQVRDWLHVEDHCSGLLTVLEAGTPGDTFCIGSRSTVPNIELVKTLLDAVDSHLGHPVGHSHQLLTFVEDRPGHDFRYAIDPTHIESALGWQAKISLKDGLHQTIEWYIEHREAIDRIRQGEHRSFEEKWYGHRLGER